MKNGTEVEYGGNCPVHGGKAKKEYGFGKYAKAPLPEAFVTIYHGCSCAVSTHGASLKKLYFDSYQDASSEARFTVQRLNAHYR
jgi:hypothetical protein